MESRVVLPAPLGPITAMSSPRPALRDTPRSVTLSVALDQVVCSDGRSRPGAGFHRAQIGRIAPGEASLHRRTWWAAWAGGRCPPCCRLCATSTSPTSWSPTARTRREESGFPRRRPRELLETGVDAIKLGNRAYRHREVYGYLDREERIVRPASYPKGSPGRGRTRGGAGRAAAGRDQPFGPGVSRRRSLTFSEADSLLAELRDRTDWMLIDMRGSHQRRWPWDGTWTAAPRPASAPAHVPTADARVLPGGTAYVTDVGLTGPRGGVIGVKRELALERFPDAHPGAIRDVCRGSMAERSAGGSRQRRLARPPFGGCSCRCATAPACLVGHPLAYLEADVLPPEEPGCQREAPFLAAQRRRAPRPASSGNELAGARSVAFSVSLGRGRCGAIRATVGRAEPDDVEIEPVRRGELHGDEHGCAQSGRLRQARPAGRHCHQQREPPRPPWLIVWSQPSRSTCPQMLNGEGRPPGSRPYSRTTRANRRPARTAGPSPRG